MLSLLTITVYDSGPVLAAATAVGRASGRESTRRIHGGWRRSKTFILFPSTQAIVFFLPQYFKNKVLSSLYKSVLIRKVSVRTNKAFILDIVIFPFRVLVVIV